MRVYSIFYLIITYFVNSLFLFIYTSIGGKVESENILQFLSSSFAYVIPYTLINFILTGIASIYFLKLVSEKKKYLLLLPLLLALPLDILFFTLFFNNTDTLIICIRAMLILLSYCLLYYSVNFYRWTKKVS